MLPINSISVHNAAPTCARSWCCYHWRYETMPRFLPPPIKPVITASHSVVVRTGPTDFNWIPTLPLSLSQLSGRWLTFFSWYSYLSVTLQKLRLVFIITIRHGMSWHKSPHRTCRPRATLTYQWTFLWMKNNIFYSKNVQKLRRELTETNYNPYCAYSTIFHDNAQWWPKATLTKA